MKDQVLLSPEELERLVMLDEHGIEECEDCLTWHAPTEIARKKHRRTCTAADKCRDLGK